MSVLEELGQPISAANTCGTIAALTERLARDLDAAENVLRANCELFEQRGEWAYLATQAADLADVLYERGRFDEAAGWTRTAERHAAPDDLGAQFTWRSVRAKVVAQAGELDEADELARRAIELVDRTDALNQRANVRLDRARVLQLGKQADAAAAVASDAAEMYEQKGNVVSARVARSMIERLATV
jgi:tetratricopeptide (TPR) repeat protein